MKVYQALLPLAAAMMIAGCGNRGTAQNVVGRPTAWSPSCDPKHR